MWKESLTGRETAPSAKAMTETIEGLAVGGTLLAVGAPLEPMEVSVPQLLTRRRGIQGRPSGTARDSQDTLEFSKFTGVRPMIEKFPLQGCEEGVRADGERGGAVPRGADDVREEEAKK